MTVTQPNQKRDSSLTLKGVSVRLLSDFERTVRLIAGVTRTWCIASSGYNNLKITVIWDVGILIPTRKTFGLATNLRRFSHIPLIGRPPPCTVVSGCREFLALFFCVLSRQMGFSARFSRVIPARNMRPLRSLLPKLL